MTTITWLFRKKRNLGNFSIENSFSETLNQWVKESRPRWVEVGNFSEGLQNRIRIIREVRSIRTDILHITGDINFAALAWPKWKSNRPKVVLTIHDIGIIKELSGLKRWLMKTIWIDWPLSCIDHLVVVSDATKKSIMQEAPWFKASKITVIPTVIPSHFKRREKEPNNIKTIALHIGLASNKNLKGHAKAISGLDVHLRIIGEPSKEDHEILREQNVDYSWASGLTNDEMQAEYANADMLLFASTLEGFGMPILEAQIVGVPVITSNISPMKDIAGKGAILVDPHDVTSIKSGVLELLENPTQVEKFTSTTNPLRFEASNSAQMLSELYFKLLP